MAKVETRPTKPSVEAAKRIRSLRQRMKLSQSELGRRVNSSSMSVSRWERGILAPLADVYIQLGHLAGDPECWYFWRQAGLRGEDLMRVLPAIRKRLLDNRLPTLQVVHWDGRIPKKQITNLVAIPLLPVVAADRPQQSGNEPDLYEVRPEAVLAAPSSWCPNPSFTTCLRVQGDSMTPLVHSGYIIVIDTSQTNPAELDGDIVVASLEAGGLVVSRLMCFDHVEVLVPDNREYGTIILCKGKWRIIGKVLWWIGRAVRPE